MPGRVYNLLAEHALDRHGYVTASDARELGVDPHRLVEMARRGTVERVGRGVYRMAVTAPTGVEQLVEATLWPRATAANGGDVPSGVLSHETALDLHDLGDFNPARIHVTVPAGYRVNPRRRKPAVYELHWRDLAAGDVTLYEGVPVVTPYRAVLDGIESHLRGDLLRQAVDTAIRRGLLAPAQVKQIGELLPGAADR
jgi:predicted transcriptional regulator of viral defense system